MTLILVDNNEKATNPEVVENLKKHFQIVICANLTAGDVNIPLDDGTVLAIERKTPHDFLASIADGRIFEQIERMAAYAKYFAIIITGKISYDKEDMVIIEGDKRKRLWHGASVRAVFSVIQFSGCALIWCPADEYPRMIEELYKTVNKPDARHGIRHRRIITFPPVDERIQILAQFPGIGLQRAESLLTFANNGLDNDEEEYGTLGKAFEWGTVMSKVDKDIRPAGWGGKTILNFRKMLGLQSNEYIKVEEDNT